MKSLETVQRECCEHYGANYSPVGAEQLVVISEGIYEGVVPVEGVRYLSPDHMSGWWLTTDKYNGDTDTLKTVHFHHIEELRPDLAFYMALPFGYRFQLGGAEENVWFDEAVARESG
jgi:hypothetical protein